MPYKSYYSFKEWWGELTQSSYYKDYAKTNPVEASSIAELAQKKIEQKAYHLPIDIAKTHFGKCIVMMMVTLSAFTTE